LEAIISIKYSITYILNSFKKVKMALLALKIEKKLFKRNHFIFMLLQEYSFVNVAHFGKIIEFFF